MISFRREMPPSMLADLLGRLAISLAAGIDVRKAWRSEATRVPAAWRPAMNAVSDALAEGSPLAEALAAAGQAFPPLVRGMVAVGDHTGREAETLHDLAMALDRGVRANRQLRRSLVGPTVQHVVALAVVGFLIFMGGMMQHDMLRVGLRGGRGLAVYAIVLVVAGAAATVSWAWAASSWRRYGVVRRVIELVPVIGPAARAAESAAWCRAAALAGGAGLDAGRLVTLASAAAPGLAVSATTIEDALRSGSSLTEALGSTRRFGRRLLDGVAVGEATGRIAEVLDRLADQFDDESRAGFEAAARAVGWLVWALVATLITVLIVRIFSVYVGVLRGAGRGL